MAKYIPPGNSGGLESPSGGHLHYKSIVIVIPPVLDEDGNILSLLNEIDEYSYFIHRLLDSISIYQPIEFIEESVKILDVSDLQLSFTEDEDLLIYYKILDRIVRRMYKPLVCMSTVSKSIESAIPDIILAEETEANVDVDVALFNVPEPQYIWDEVTQGVSYLVSRDSIKYQARNIIEHANKGPLMSSLEILEPVITKLEAKRYQ
jgi:hypothetical protein